MLVVATIAAAHAQAPGTAAFRDCDDCPEMAEIRAGAFRMGTTRDAAYSAAETPRREVQIGAAFAVGRFEVTRAQFAHFVKATSYAGAEGKGCIVLRHVDMTWVNDASRSWRDPGFEQGDDHPVVCVSWQDAKAYVEWLSAKTGKKYRLPSEAEWEYVARAGSRESRPWGEDDRQACKHANVWDETYGKERGLPAPPTQAFRPEVSIGTFGVRDTSASTKRPHGATPWYRSGHWCSDAHALTAPAGKLAANAFGVHDAIGNAWEWAEDCMNPDHSEASGDGGARQTGTCDLRVVRGGSWSSTAWEARSAARQFRPVTYRRSDLGFRVARAL